MVLKNGEYVGEALWSDSENCYIVNLGNSFNLNWKTVPKGYKLVEEK